MNGPGTRLTLETALELMRLSELEGNGANIEIKQQRRDEEGRIVYHWYTTEEAAHLYIDAAKERLASGQQELAI